VNAYLHCQNGHRNDAVYSLHLRPTDAQQWVVMGWFGARNSTLQTRKGAFKGFPTISAARAEFDARLNSKIGKGYQSVAPAVVWPLGEHWLITAPAALPHQTIAQVAAGSAPPTTTPFAQTARRTKRTYTAPTAPPPQPQPPPQPKPRHATTGTNPVPPWILSCFHELPKQSRAKAVEILTACFSQDEHHFQMAAQRPEPRPVDWMRAAFSRLPVPQRKQLYRQFNKVLHSDYSHDSELTRRWIEAYTRFSS
jgi:hypothetical protein